MASEEGIALRSRRVVPKTSGIMDMEGSNGNPRITSNGKMDVEEVISKKMQLKMKVEHLKAELMKQLDSQVDEFVDSLIEESASACLDPPSVSSVFSPPLSDKERNRLRQLRPPQEQGKLFMIRRSLLDELFEVNHIRTIYHMFIALLILFILSTLVVDFLDQGRLVLDFDLLVYAFGQLPLVVSTWLCMFLSALVVPYGLFHLWASHYHMSQYQTLLTVLVGAFFLLYQALGLGFFPTFVVLMNSFPPASRFIIILEQVRLMMKVHSFMRENVPRVMTSACDKSTPLAIPQLTQYLYFLFAPTLVYRDSYPRNPVIRWGYVATKFLQVLGCLFYAYYVFVRLCIPQYRSTNLQVFDLRVIVLCVFNSILPGVLVFFLAFYAFLHCWLNAFAEMLRFGDRMFYKDWWNSTSFANYYRTWNVVVHDWLYNYVYRDFLWMSGRRFRAAAMLFVFTISAVVHEYILAVCFGFFYPVLFCLFMCFGMVFNFIVHDRRKSPIWNVIMWCSLFLGHGMLFCLYSQEWYAQRYCPLEEPSFLDLLKPRSWTCHKQMASAL